MPINAHPDYLAAEAEYLKAESTEEKIEKLKKMISLAPGHKGAENLRAQLKTRLKKFQEQQEKQKKVGKSNSSRNSIKKEEMQCMIIGKTNSGKSSLLKLLTNAEPKISSGEFSKFTTISPQQGMMNYATTQIQIVEIPAIDSEFYDKGLVYTTDTVLILANNLEDVKEIIKNLKTKGKKIIVINKADKLSNEEKRKISATLKSKFKKYNFEIISCKNSESEEFKQLKEKIFQSFDKIRVYTKEPGKPFDKAKQKPMILSPGSTIKNVAEKILKGFSSRIKETKIWGPSSKFSGQIVGLKHKMKDLDVVEFKTN
jgi:ribosome-interacting GTPase 1